MGIHWFGIVRRKLFRSTPHRNIVVFHTNNTVASSFSEATVADQGPKLYLSSSKHENEQFLSEEDVAAVKIQAYFRGHLARRAFRALRSLVRLQAVVRGVCVRRQARIALHCMHALARLQVTVRARQLLSRR